MPFAPRPFVEHPDLRVPIALVVDDPAPCINPLWYFRHQVDGQESPAYARTIPLSFMEDWCRWVSESGVRGDFTVLPFPAGLGRVDRALDGFDTDEVRAWLALAREAVASRFDIHPEILTHTNALDLQTRTLLPVSEHEWTEAQDEQTLADYMAAAMEILGGAGLPNHGLTQPCYYRADESLYARAVLAAEKRVNGRSVTHNFLHMDSAAPLVPPRITHLDEAAGEAVVSVWTGTNDYVWNTQERDHPDREAPPETLADRFLTEDGQGGRLAELLRGGGPIVMVTHWQSLFSNGTGLGLKTHQEVARRVASALGERVAWRRLSEIATHHLAASTARLEATATAETAAVVVSCPFATDTLTVSVPTPWPLHHDPEVSVDGQSLPPCAGPSGLTAGRWVRRGAVITVSLALAAGQRRTVTIHALPE